MTNYYLAPSLADLRNEVNAANSKRDHSSDGWIGDDSHAARVSDHNPDWSAGGVVRALDIDKDGSDPMALVRIACADPRVEYVIFNGLIYLRANGFRPQKYTGPNKHTGHVHVSLRHTRDAERPGRWGYRTPSPSPSPTHAPARKSIDQLVKEIIAGHWGNGPDRSRRLVAAGYNASAVQAEVNRRLGVSSGAHHPTRPSVSLLATQVIAGQWSNGPERAKRLTAAGYDAKAVQAEVNRRLLRR